MRTYANTIYKTLKGEHYSISWKIADTKFINSMWQPQQVFITLRKEFSESYEMNYWYDPLDVHKENGSPTWQPKYIALPSGVFNTTTYFKNIWYKRFTDMDEAARVYQDLLEKKFDDYIMESIL